MKSIKIATPLAGQLAGTVQRIIISFSSLQEIEQWTLGYIAN